MEDFYMFLSSLDSNDLYPDNTSNSFKVNLRKNLKLEGSWSVGLIRFKCNFETPPVAAHIECDICQESYVFNTYRPVLNVIYPKFKRYIEPFYEVAYVPIITNTFGKLKISIRGGECVGPVFCVLHFKKNGSLENTFPFNGKG
jgi:hypothetical protein